MLKDLPKGLLATVAAINQKSREAYVAEQQTARKPKLPGVPQPKADPAAHAAAGAMAKANIKEGVQGTTPRNEKEKQLAAKHGDKTKITHGDVLKARGVVKEEEQVEEGVIDTLKKVGKKVIDTVSHADDKELIKKLQKDAGVPQTGEKPKKSMKEGWEEMMKSVRERNKAKPNGGAGKKQGSSYGGSKQKDEKEVKEDVQIDEALKTVSKHGEGTGEHHAVVKRDAEWNEYQVHFYKNGKHMGEGPVSHHDDKKDAQDTAESEVKRMNMKKEEVEQIDELSKTTLKSYTDKAAQNVADSVVKANKLAGVAADARARGDSKVNRNISKQMDKASDKLVSHAYKRLGGLEKAKTRLKEDVALSAEESARIAEIAKQFEGK